MMIWWVDLLLVDLIKYGIVIISVAVKLVQNKIQMILIL